MLTLRRLAHVTVALHLAIWLPSPASAQRMSLDNRDAVARAIDSRLPADRSRARLETTYGVLRHALLHEIGHFLIEEYRIARVGREEDMADRFAAFSLGNSVSLTEVLAPVRFWLVKAQQRTAATSGRTSPSLAWDEHGLDEQRAMQHICLMAGRDSALFAELFPRFGAPLERAVKCVLEAEENARAWTIILEPQLVKREDTKDKGDPVLNTIFAMREMSRLRQATRVTYETAPAGLAEIRKFVQDSRLLDDVAQLIGSFRRPRWRVDLLKTMAANELESRCGPKESPLTGKRQLPSPSPSAGAPRARDSGCDTDLGRLLAKPTKEQQLERQKKLVLDAPVVVAAKACGQPNAYFQRGSPIKPYLEREMAQDYQPPTIALCYELAAHIYTMTKALFPDPEQPAR